MYLETVAVEAGVVEGQLTHLLKDSVKESIEESTEHLKFPCHSQVESVVIVSVPALKV